MPGTAIGKLSREKNLPNLLRNFSAKVWRFVRKGGGLPYSKTFEELFSLSLDIFQEDGGRLPDSKDDEVLFSALA